MKQQIMDYIKQHGTGKGMEKQFKRFKWLAARSDFNTGIVKIQGKKFYFYVVAPWEYCPNGIYEVECAQS